MVDVVAPTSRGPVRERRAGVGSASSPVLHAVVDHLQRHRRPAAVAGDGRDRLAAAGAEPKSKAFQAGPGDRDTALERETEDRKLAYEAGRSPGGRGFVVPDQDACPASAIVRLEIGAEQAVRWT